MFSWTPLRWLGNMSYSYYLIHGLTLKGIALVMMRVIPPSTPATAAFWLGYPLFFFLTLLSSTLLFIFVEKRFSLMPVNTAKPAQMEATQMGEAAALSSEMSMPQLNAWQGVPKSE